MKNPLVGGASAILLAGLLAVIAMPHAKAPAPQPAAQASIDWADLISKLLTRIVDQPTAPEVPPGLMRITVDTEKVPGQGRIRVDGDFPLIKWDTDTPHEKVENDRVVFFSLSGPPADFVIAATDGKTLDLRRVRVGKPTPAPDKPPVVTPPVVTPDPTTRPARATYVYEQRQGSVPPPVLTALDKLNRAGVVATSVDQNVINGKGQIPVQYAVALEAAKREGIPCLVVEYTSGATKVVKAPKTEKEVTEAVK